MCLSLAIQRPHDVLASGTEAGFDWIVTNNGNAYRCGYVKVGPGHPWWGFDMYDADMVASAHGGITFAEADEPCGQGGEDAGWWLGFDAAHAGDEQDPALPSTYNLAGMGLGGGGVVRTQEYMEDQCRALCRQAAAARDPQPRGTESLP